MLSKLPWPQKQMFWAFQTVIFQFFRSFWMTKLKPLSGKARKSLKDHLNSKLMIGTFLKNDFEATLSSKANVLDVWKEYFSIFCKFLIQEVEPVFWESEAKHKKLFKSKLGHKKLLRKWFWSYLQLKNERSRRLERTFFRFFANAWVMRLKTFSAKERKRFQDNLNSKLVTVSFLEKGFQVSLR